MTAYIIVRLIDFIANVLVIIVIVDSILSYFLSPYHPLRSALDRIVQPLLAPIRRFVPLVGMLDFSPLVLIILIEIAAFLLGNLIYAL
ncbi:MAG: YggT family protein [Chloroflexota bacterium]|jgi:YggT family protein